MIDGAHHPQNIGLPGGKPGNFSPKPGLVIVCPVYRHVFHPTARGDERVLKQGKFAGPVDQCIQSGGDKRFTRGEFHSHSNAPLRQVYANPTSRMTKNTAITARP